MGIGLLPGGIILDGGADAGGEAEGAVGAILSGCPGVKRMRSTKRVCVYGGGSRMYLMSLLNDSSINFVSTNKLRSGLSVAKSVQGANTVNKVRNLPGCLTRTSEKGYPLFFLTQHKGHVKRLRGAFGSVFGKNTHPPWYSLPHSSHSTVGKLRR